jgi:lysine-specific demethylase/histidyl-hydroxylase NO66
LKIPNKDVTDKTDVAQLDIARAQEHFRAEAKHRIMRVAKEAMDMLDAACDQVGKQYITSCQPPALTPTEKAMSSATDEKALKVLPNMMVRLLRPNIARLVLEDGMAVVYHCMDNSRIYHGKPNSPLEFETDDAPAIEQLLKTLEPHWICVEDLYHDTIEDKVGVVQSLYDEGLLALRK